MKLSARINKHIKCFDDALDLLGNILRTNSYEAEYFLHGFRNNLEGAKFPCDKLCFDALTGYGNRFDLIASYEDEQTAYCQISVNSYGLLTIEQRDYKINATQKLFESFFENYNSQIFTHELKKLGVSNLTEQTTLKCDYYTDYNYNGNTREIEGSLLDIFSALTTYNETRRYCNGDYCKFSNPIAEKVYHMYTSTMYKGNYFLNHALQRGALID